MVEFLLRRGFDLEAKDNVRFLLSCMAYFIIYIFSYWAVSTFYCNPLTQPKKPDCLNDMAC
jgi:hypothetical protein